MSRDIYPNETFQLTEQDRYNQAAFLQDYKQQILLWTAQKKLLELFIREEFVQAVTLLCYLYAQFSEAIKDKSNRLLIVEIG